MHHRAHTAKRGAGPRVDAGVAAVEAVGPAPAAGALLGGVVLGVRTARLEASQDAASCASIKVFRDD